MPVQQGCYNQLLQHTHQTPGQGGQIDHGAALVGLGDSDHAAHYDVNGLKDIEGILQLNVGAVAEIVAGEITVNRSCVYVETEGGIPADNLDIINPSGVAARGSILFVRAADTTHTVVIRDGIGNISCRSAGDITLDDNDQMAMFIFSSAASLWIFIGYSDLLTKARIDALNIDADTVDGEDIPGTIANILTNHTKAVHDDLMIEGFNVGFDVHLTLAANAFTRTKNFHELSGQAGGDDDLDTINGLVEGLVLILKTSGSEIITVRHGIGNIQLRGGQNFIMEDIEDILVLICTSSAGGGIWVELSRTYLNVPPIEGLYAGSHSELTIDGAGEITVTQNYHRIDGAGDAADDLEVINGGVEGMVLVLQCESGARVITVKHMGGNIRLEAAGDKDLTTTRYKLTLIYDALDSKWHQISYSQ